MLCVMVHCRLAVTEQGAFPRGHWVTWLCPKMSWGLTHQQTPHPQLAHLPPPGSLPFLQHKFRTPACPPTVALLHILTEEATVRGGGAESELGWGFRGRRAPTLQEGNLDVLAVQGDATPVLQLQEAVVRAGQADGDGAGADRIRVVGTLPGGACRGASPPPPAQPPTHSLREKPQPGSLSFAHSEPLPPQDSRLCLSLFLGPVVPKGIGDLDPQGAPRLSSPLLGGPEERSTRGVSLALIPVGIPGLPGGLTWTVSMTTEKEWSWQSWASRYWQTPLKVKCLSSKLLKWDCPVIRHSPGETGGRGEWVSQQDPWGDKGGESGCPNGSPGGEGERERGYPSRSSGGQGGGESGYPRGFPGETGGKRERVSQWVPWGVSQWGALPGFLHITV